MNADTVRELLSNATPGEWHADYVGDDTYLISDTTPGTLDGNLRTVGLISHMPEDTRIAHSALIAAAPAVAQWGLERDAEVARLREALERVESQIAEFEVNYRGTLRGMDGWYGPLYPEDDSSMGVFPALRAALEGTS